MPIVRKLIKWVLFGLLALLIVAAGLGAQTWFGKPLSINWFYNKIFLKFALDSPEMLTSMRLLEPAGIRGHNARLSDSSDAHELAQIAQMKVDYATFKSYDATGLTGQARISNEVFDQFVSMSLAGEKWRLHDYPINQMFGIQTQLPNLLAQQQQVHDVTDAKHFIARLNAFPVKISQVIDGVNLRAAKGVVPPAITIEKVLAQIKAFLAPGAQGNSIAVAFKTKLDKIPADKMDAATRTDLLAQVESAIKTRVEPAYQNLTKALIALQAKATGNNGVWSLPDGDKYYEYAIEQQTTTKMTADEIHQLGLKEVARLSVEMDTILKQVGYEQGSIAERIGILNSAPDQLYPNNDEGRAQILKDYQTIINEVSSGLDKSFNIKPKASVEVKRVPQFSEAGAPGAYYQPPAMDASRPGTFYANLKDIGETPKYSMRTLAYHEAIPGHHLQLAIAQEIPGLPIFRQAVPFTAFMEGWALYAERLAWETGYQSKPLDNLGRLQAEMFRSVRLVVDTGLHAKRWTREQAIDYMTSNTGMPKESVISEIERYLVNPGQALAYKIGMIKILELRERAKTKLGDKFKLATFHDEVLQNGAVPLSVLERVIDEYIARTLATSVKP